MLSLRAARIRRPAAQLRWRHLLDAAACALAGRAKLTDASDVDDDGRDENQN